MGVGLPANRLEKFFRKLEQINEAKSNRDPCSYVMIDLRSITR